MTAGAETGGLTEAPLPRDAICATGCGTIVGRTVSERLSAALASPVAQGGDFVDLRGQLPLAWDRYHPPPHDRSRTHPSRSELWG